MTARNAREKTGRRLERLRGVRTMIDRLASPAFAVAVAFAMLALAAPASAQPADAPGDVRAIQVVAASASPRVGEQVVDEAGAVSGDYFSEARICTFRGCRRFVFDTRSGALIGNDGLWTPAYAPTGRGAEVIRVRAFTDAERPPTGPPSDKPLESAPAIKKVVRPAPAKAE